MNDASSHGHAPPRTKTINVEANLLGERLRERDKLRQALQRKALLTLAVTGAAAATLPTLLGYMSQASDKANQTQRLESNLQTQLSSLRSKGDKAQPRIADQEMMEKVKTNADIIVGQATLVMNCASPQIAFADLKTEVLGGELRISCRADAESFSVAQRFVSGAGQGPKVIDAILASTKRSDVIAKGGIAIEFVKRVKVEL